MTFYIGYLSGQSHEMWPEVIVQSYAGQFTPGKAWGSYVNVAGPYASKAEALKSLKASWGMLARSLKSGR